MTKVGRPGREPISLRVTPETKRALDAAAEQSGRSLSQEAELWLESYRQNQQATKRRPGRPPNSAAGPKRENVKLRIHDRTRAALEASAAEKARSLSEEAEARIEQTFRNDGLDKAVADAVFEAFRLLRGCGKILVVPGDAT